MMQGRFADAKQAADRVAEQLNPHAEMMPMVESMVVMPVAVLLRFAKHGEVLALQPPPPARTVQTAFHHFARGTALARTGKADEAAAERTLLTAAIAAVPETAAYRRRRMGDGEERACGRGGVTGRPHRRGTR